MATVALRQLQPGMILSREVRDLSGRLLLNRGEKITGKHLKILKAWGVAEIEVEEPTSQAVSRPPVADVCLRDPEKLRAVRERALALYRFNDPATALIQELCEHTVRVLCRREGQGGGDDD